MARLREEDQPGESGEAGLAGSPERVVEVLEEHDMYIGRSTPKRHLQCRKKLSPVPMRPQIIKCPFQRVRRILFEIG